MCVPAFLQQVSRRQFFGAAGAAAAASVVGRDASAKSPAPRPDRTTISFSRVVDLTHTMTPDFPTYSGQKQLEMERLGTLAENGYNIYKWLLVEHTGTHLDAPFHFSDRDPADLIPISDLVGPLAVVDIRARAEGDPDAQLTPDDLKAWEGKHGPIPDGGIVAMCSGWDAHVRTAKFRNADDQKGLHFPGFHVEAVAFLLEGRKVKGIMVDTLSLDHGASKDFAAHYRWLPANRWGMECVAHLGDLPPKGATVVAGGPKVAGATGGLSRVLAFV